MTGSGKLAVLGAALLWASGCNCGRSGGLSMTEAGLALPADLLDFGAVEEGTSKASKFRVENTGRSAVAFTVVSQAGSSPEFKLGERVPTSVEAGGYVEVPVIFAPVGLGEDEGALEVRSSAGGAALVQRLRGGPIAPALTFEPDPLDFKGTTSDLESKSVQLRSTGTATLTVRAIGVAPTGNPDFAVSPPALPKVLLPGESFAVRVDYARSARATEGLLEVLSDAADGGAQRLRLLPDPPGACSDGLDNDADGLIDFPADPGCQDAKDSDESNPAQCVDGASQPCPVDGGCPGRRTCSGGAFGACLPTPGCGVDAGPGPVDAGCNPTGVYTVAGNALSYTCCLGFVGFNISRFQLQSSATQTTVTPGPSHPGSLTAPTPLVCGGSFDVERVIPGGCTETYRLQGSFTGPDSFAGTYSATFTGADCSGALCFGQNCVDQTFAITAGK